MENIGDDAVTISGEAWHSDLSWRIGRAIKSRRDGLKITAQELAKRCSDLGVPIHRTTITKIENGRARFDLGELIVLAAALNTAPVALVYPGPYEAIVDVTPKQKAREFEAAQWFSGMRPGFAGSEKRPDPKELAQRRAEHRDHMDTLATLRQIEEIEQLKKEELEKPDPDRQQIAFYDRHMRYLKHRVDPDAWMLDPDA